MLHALLLEPACSGRGGNEEEKNVEGEEENICYPDTNYVSDCYILSTCLVTYKHFYLLFTDLC